MIYVFIFIENSCNVCVFCKIIFSAKLDFFKATSVILNRLKDCKEITEHNIAASQEINC